MRSVSAHCRAGERGTLIAKLSTGPLRVLGATGCMRFSRPGLVRTRDMAESATERSADTFQILPPHDARRHPSKADDSTIREPAFCAIRELEVGSCSVLLGPPGSTGGAQPVPLLDDPYEICINCVDRVGRISCGLARFPKSVQRSTRGKNAESGRVSSPDDALRLRCDRRPPPTR